MFITSEDCCDPINRRMAGRSIRRSAWLAAALMMCLCTPACSWAQHQGSATPAQFPQEQESASGATSSPDIAFEQRRMRALNAERQKELVADTDRLLKLTAELETEVKKNKSTSLAPDQLRQLARIEKLARSVKDKMSNPVQTSVLDDEFPQRGVSLAPF